jgi:hypothetical protein
MEMAYLVLIWLCFNCSGPFQIDGDVVFLNNICIGIFAIE